MRAWATLLIASIVGVIGLGAYAGWNLRDLPQPGNAAGIIREVDIFDRGGQLMAQRSPDGQFHVYTALDQMGPYAATATLAAEDRDFYRHGSLDAPAMMRAAATDIVKGAPVEGGSTITQQLVKIELLGPERTVSRKVQEAFLAWAMERRYKKDQILEMYLNRVFYGHGAYGIGSAVKTYFGRDRDVKSLTAAQAAFLAGLLQAPNGLDPKTNYDGARARQLYVLHGMQVMGTLTAAQEEQAAQENVRAELKFDVTYRAAAAPHFVEYVMAQAEKQLGAATVQQGGLQIYTTLDSGLQNLAEQAVASGVRDLGRDGVNNGDLLAARPGTGEILAWVGSADFGNDGIGGQFDVIRSPLQPGSSFKPYVYAAALRDQKITLCTTLEDRPTDFNGFNPPLHDWDNKFMGPMSARRALLLSRNVPAVEVAQVEGMDAVNSLATQMGIGTDLQPGLSGAIGTSLVTMHDQVEAYGVFANQGRKVPLVAITRIADAQGTLFQQPPGTQQGQQAVLSPQVSYLVTSVLQDYPRYWGLGWNRQMAGKSGTTGSETGVHPNAWMMAYSPDIVVGAWAGNTGPDGRTNPTSAFGTNVGSTISARFINGLPRAAFNRTFSRPAGLVQGRNGELFLPGTQTKGCSQGLGDLNIDIGPIHIELGNGDNGNGNGRKKNPSPSP